MTEKLNPYAPPTPIADAPPPRRATKARGGGSGIWQENGLLVFEKEGGSLPDRCVVCNKKTDYKLRTHYSWHPPAYYALALLGGIFYSIAMASVRKNVTLELGLCEEHRVKRRSGLLVAGLGALAAIVFLAIGISSHWTALLLLSLTAIVILPIVGLRMARVAGVSKIDDTHAWFKVAEPFLASLPAYRHDYESSLEDMLGAIKKKKKKKVKKAAKPAPVGNEAPAPTANADADDEADADEGADANEARGPTDKPAGDDQPPAS